MTGSLFPLFTLPVRIIRAGLSPVTAVLHQAQSSGQSSQPPASHPPSGLIEAGLVTINTALQSIQSAISRVAGQTPPKPLTAPPLEGPGDIDSAASDFANRLAGIVRFTPFEAPELAAGLKKALSAARISFGNIDPANRNSVVFPMQLALSFSTLFIQQALRMLVTYEMVGPEKYLRFITDFTESFTDTPIYVGLEYRALIEDYEARLVQRPDDAAIRVELGRTQIKCGLHDQAADNLLKASDNPSVRALALHEAAVALHRAGKLERAARVGSSALTANPGNERARAWLWLTAQQLGGYPEFIPVDQRMQMKVGYDQPTVEFEDIAPRIGLDKTSGGRGVAVFDYNNDGLLDVAIASAHGGCNLYRNNGDGTFTDVSVSSGLDAAINSFIITVGDYNNDGFADLFITRLGFYVGEGQLYRNNGDGTFTDVTAQAGLKVWGPAFSASWVDYDCDGRLDLFIANNMGGMFDRKTPNRLFHNNGDGTFTEVTEEAGLSTMWPTIGSAWGDYNNDGYPDLFLSNALGKSQLYRNNGDGTFTDVSAEANIGDNCFGSISLWCDYDNDGLLDIVQFTWSDHENVIHTMRHGEGPPDGKPARIYHNNGDGTFTLRSRDIGLTGCWGTMSGNAGDFNNDGNIDLVLGNGSPRMDRLEPPILLENDGKRFRNVTFAAGLPFGGKGHGSNMADLFGDGRLSVIVASGGAYPGDLLTTRVFYPKRLPGNYLNVRLEGTTSNRSAIGARICLEADGRKQYRDVSGGTNFGCLPFEQHFGLAAAHKVDALQIRWPSGLVQRFTGLPINDTVRFTEGRTGWERPYQP
ncbi:MAG: CRTAC1 family protein [Acidobacteriia bacterium]|nr:CRTAC1 family protein [Terriglobia bacterium]